ncbi:MAG: efflux RND transporter periplasmic adaptor subunit [Rhodospirillales bacterium]
MVALVVAAVLIAAPPAHAQNKQKEITVSIDEVINEPLKQTFPVIGRLVASRTGVVAARIRGPVGKFHVKVGDRVKKGDAIATLVADRLDWERRLRAAKVRESEAALKSAGALRNLRLQELKRLEKLRKSAAFSQARLDDKKQEVAQAQSATAEAEAALMSAKANLKLAEIDVYNTTVRAPYPGVVSKRHTEVGSYVDVGKPVVTLIDDQHLEIEADVPAQRIPGLVPGLEISFRIDSTKTLSAIVRAVVPEENPLTRTRAVRFTPNLDGAGANLANSQSVTLFLPVDASKNAVTVHKDAVINRKGINLVFIVKDGAAEIRQVTLGQAIGGRFEVISGLSPGDRVVVRGNERLRPGQKVRTGE